MAAQSSRLGAVADNIANSKTVGYKRASTEFSSLVLASGTKQYQSGTVMTHTRNLISEQGALEYTTSPTDLAVRGQGFFVVEGLDGSTVLTRAGAFVKNSAGELVNTAGYKLMGYSLANGPPAIVANGTAGLEPINIDSLSLQANASTAGDFFVNLPLDAAIVPAADLPSLNDGGEVWTAKSSLIVHGNLGREVTLDVYMTKTAAGEWEVAVFDQAEAATGGGFPYASGPLDTATLEFDGVTGRLTSTSASSLSIPVPNGGTLALNMAQSSQLDADYTVRTAIVNGNGVSEVDRIEISDTGELFAVYENGARIATYVVPLANVSSPDNLTPLAGNVFATNKESGDIQMGFPTTSGLGLIESSALEQSTVDLASELTNMIEAQRNFTANSKVFNTGAELMDVLVNLGR
jgi:flagellar hook protein FlgE